MDDRRTSAGNLGPDSGLIGPGWGDIITGELAGDIISG